MSSEAQVVIVIILIIALVNSLLRSGDTGTVEQTPAQLDHKFGKQRNSNHS